ncbi:Endo-1,4-beta-xylanase 5-like [Sesamum angolense]|uniref:Endo-1,4-beta-xylanase 5-like n=1 Tax=Sesamum angolense TaxID=2727404 RepID=A0AAE1W2H6_9LAMI|nr:Endo-1,4-beta-xylanase 5-like [Sesamum angolense]
MAARMPFISLMILIIISAGNYINAHEVPYDYSFTHECLAKPLKPQYGGGIAVNPELNEGCRGWSQTGNTKIGSKDGNNYFVASVINNQSSPVHKFYLHHDKLYPFSGWFQVSKGKAFIEAIFKTQTYEVTAGFVAAQEGCWTMLKGGIVVNASGPAELYFKSVDIDPTAEIWVDSISLQPFTQQEWKCHQDQSMQKVRKTKVKFHVVDNQGRPLPNAKVSIKQTRLDFPFGTAITEHILNNTAYQNWFTSRFKYTVFENEMKWYFNEKVRGVVDYSVTDAMVQFAKSHGVAIRGHTVLWEDRNFQPPWLIDFPINRSEEYRALTDSRVHSVMNRYKGQLIHWDVVNENLHHWFIQDILGKNSSAVYYKKAHEIDPNTLLFLNEYMTVEKSGDRRASPWKYLQKIWEMREQGYTGPLGIGAQAHFGAVMNLPYLRASIDVLDSAKLPIWISELDVNNITGSNQACYLEQIIRELHAHRAVQGILMWSAITPGVGCWRMCLTDSNFKNLPTGDVVDKIIAEWTHAGGVQGTTNANGCFETPLFHGDYEASISLPTVNKQPVLQKFKVVPNGKAEVVVVKICT